MKVKLSWYFFFLFLFFFLLQGDFPLWVLWILVFFLREVGNKVLGSRGSPLLGCFHTELKSEEEIHVDIDKSIDLDINMDMDMDMDTDTDMDMDKTGLRFGLKC